MEKLYKLPQSYYPMFTELFFRLGKTMAHKLVLSAIELIEEVENVIAEKIFFRLRLGVIFWISLLVSLLYNFRENDFGASILKE